MSKIFFKMIPTFFLIALVGCTNSEVIESDKQDVVDFSGAVGKVTSRGSAIDITGLKTTGFYVTATPTGSANWATNGSNLAPSASFFKNVAVSWNATDSKWTYSPMKLWPTDTYVTFFAYSPTDASVSLNADANGAPKITYTAPDAAENQVDLMACMNPDVNRAVSGNSVSFAFDHLLSKIGFSAKLAQQYTGVTGVSITSLKVFYKASAVKKARIYTFATDNTVAGIWTDPGSLSYMPSGGSGDNLMNEFTTVELDNSAIPAVSQVNHNTRFLMLPPQSVAAGDVSVQVIYQVTAGNLVAAYSKTVDLPAIEWLPGKQYTYNLVITLNSVSFDNVTVGGWSAGTTPADVNI